VVARVFPSRSVPELVARRAEVAPDGIALLGPGRPDVTNARLRDHTVSVVERLRSAGVRPNDCVAVVLPNGPDLAGAFLAIASGAVCAPLNPAYTRAELEFYLDDLDARALVVGAGTDSPAKELAAERGVPVLELAPLEDGAPSAAPPSGDVARPEDVALVLHTSGTTSRPKLVPLTHANLCASARNVSAVLNLGERDRCLNVMPLFHIHGLVGAVLSSLWSGGSVACAPDFQAPRFLYWLEELAPTWYTAVPTTHQAVLARVRAEGAPGGRSRLRLVRSSSAPLPTPVLHALEEAFGVPVIESYGMTEAAHQMTSNPLPPGERKPGSVGPAAGPEVAILDEDGAVLPAGSTGEVAIRGDNVFSGYGNNPEANETVFSNGWFRTGDEGHLDEDGFLFLHGRAREIINRGGEKISPREVDEVLLAHPAVAQAVAFSVPDRRLGDEVGAAVVLRPGRSVTERELQQFAGERLADFKVPRHLAVVDEIPMGTTGKLQRIGLAERLGLGETKRPSAASAEPRTELERELAQLWREILDVERVGADDDFFALGGDSILAVELIATLRVRYGRPRLPLTTLVWAPTVTQLAAELAGDEEDAPLSPAVPVRREGSRPPFFFVHGLDGEIVGFGTLAHRLGPDQPFYAIRARGVDGEDKPHESLEEMVSDYVDSVRAVQPHGPYYLGGVCLGASVAVEMAKRLAAAGEEVGLLALVDPRVTVAKGPTYLGWQLRLGGRKVVQGDYGWRLVLPYRQKEVWGAVARELRSRFTSLDRREPAEREFEERVRAVRRTLVPSTIRGRVNVYVTLDWPLREWFWEPLVEGELVLEEIPYRHMAVLRSPGVDVLARHLGPALRAAQESTT
jgi:acyl-CoA synthetase (AMP-forming)/AMP-acid ligase II/acyl carrier protein